MSEMTSHQFDLRVLQELDRWVRSKGGKVQARLINEFYAKHPANRPNLQDQLYFLADNLSSKVHLVAGRGPGSEKSLEYLELKELGSKPLKPAEKVSVESTSAQQNQAAAKDEFVMPPFKESADGVQYVFVRDPLAVRTILEMWEPLEPFVLDVKGDVRREGRLSFMQICNKNNQILMADFADNPRMIEESGIREYMMNPAKVKIILDSARPVDAFRGILGVEPEHVLDLSRAFLVLKRHRGEQVAPNMQPSLVYMLRELGISFPKIEKPEESWFRRPLSSPQVEYSCRGVTHNVAIYSRIFGPIKDLGLEDACFRESAIHAASLRNVQSTPEPDLFSADWSCISCGFRNYGRRTTCRKCDVPRPDAQFRKPASPIVKDTPVVKPVATPPPKTRIPRTDASPISSTPKQVESFDQIEEAAMKLAVELSLQEEEARMQRFHQDQFKEFEKVGLIVTVGHYALRTNIIQTNQMKPVATNQSNGRSIQPPPQTSAAREIKRPEAASTKPQQQNGATSNNPRESMRLPAHPALVQPSSGGAQNGASTIAPTSKDFGFFQGSGGPGSSFANSYIAHSHNSLDDYDDASSPMFRAQDVEKVLDEAGANMYPPGASFPSFQIGAGVQGFGGQLMSPTYPAYGAVNMDPYSGMFRNPGSLFGSPYESTVGGAFGQPPKAQSASGQSSSGPDEDDLVLLQLDVSSLLEETGLSMSLVDAITKAAVSAGARDDLAHVPLPSLAKELDQAGMTTAQRATFLKALHARKRRV